MDKKKLAKINSVEIPSGNQALHEKTMDTPKSNDQIATDARKNLTAQNVAVLKELEGDIPFSL